MGIELTILGSGAAMPAFGRHLTAQVYQNKSFRCLIDCGEGTQMQFMRYGLKMHKINHVFISHLHGDHFFGLAGLLMTMDLQGRNKPMHVFGPDGLKHIIQTQLINPLSYDLYFYNVVPDAFGMIYENEEVQVFSIPMLHRVACTGFLLVEKRGLPNISKNKIIEHSIPYPSIVKIKQGAGYTDQNGRYISHESLVLPQANPRKYAFCSDTAYNEAILPCIEGVDLLYHEATFMHDKLEMATKTGHSTAKQAAQLARMAGVKKLVIGHFSARYKETAPLLIEAKAYFESSFIAKEGEVFEL